MNISTRELAHQIALLSRRIDALSSPQLNRSSIEDGSIHEYDVDGNLVTIIGRQDDGSHGVVVLDGPDPLRTSTPIAEAGALTIAARWDGQFIDPDTGTVDADLPAYDDFKHIEVHVGPESSFHPDRETLAGFIPNRDGGEVAVPAEAGERYVRFVTRAISGKTSVPSIAVMVEVGTLVDTEQFERLREALDAAAAWIAETGAELDRRLADAEVDLADAQAGLDDAAERLNALRDETLPALYERLEEAEERLGNIPDLLEGLQSAIDDANETLDALEGTTLPALMERLEGAEGALSDLQDTTLPALRGDVEDAQGRLDEAFGEGASWNLSDALAGVEERAQALVDALPPGGRVWRQDTPPPAGTVYRWTGTPHASTSEKVVDGEVVARNYALTTQRPAGLGNVTGEATHGVDFAGMPWTRYNVLTNNHGARTQANLVDLMPDEEYVGSWLIGNEGNDPLTVQVDVSDGGNKRTTIQPGEYRRVYSNPHAMVWTDIFRFSDCARTTPGSLLIRDVMIGKVSETGAEPAYFDGDSPDDRAGDLWIDTSLVDGRPRNVAHTWDGEWVETQDATILDALETAENTPRPHQSTNAPTTGDVMPAGTRWEQVDPTGFIIGIWVQTTEPQGGSWAQRALDLSLLRASSAVIDDLLVERMAVAIATVIELSAERITSGQIDAEFINVSDLTAALATVLELDAGQITTGELAAERIAVADLTAAIASIIELNADQITSGQIVAGQIDTSDLAATLATIIELDAGAITAGTIAAARIDAIALAAEMGEFIQARIENLVVTQGATMDTAVINKLWTEVVRSRLITTDMLLVGSGENLVPDPNFTNDALNAARISASDTGWSITSQNEGRLDELASAQTFRAVAAPPSSDGGTGGSRPGGRDTYSTGTPERFYPVTPGNVYRVRYQRRRSVLAGYLGFAQSRPVVRWINATGDSAATVYPNTLYTPASNAWAWHEAEWTAPDNAGGMYLGVQGTTGNGNALHIRNVSVTSMSDASLIVDGAIAARHIDAESIAAEVAEFITVKAEDIEAGNIRVALTLSAAGRIIAGNPSGAAAELSSRGMEVWTTDANGNRHGIPLTRLGVPGSTDVLSISDGTDVVASITPDGLFSGTGLDISDDIHVGGNLLMGAYAFRDSGGSGDRDSLMWQVPWGVQGPITDMAGVAGHLSASHNTTQLLLYDTYRLFAGRAYRWTADMTLRVADITHTEAHAILRFQKTEVNGHTSVPSIPSLSSGQNVLLRRVYTPGNSVNAPVTLTILPSRDETARVAVALSGINSTQRVERPSVFYLEDMGPSAGWGGGVAYGQSTPPVQKYTYYFYPTAILSRQGSYNSTMVWNGAAQHNKMTQGWISGVTSGPWHTFARFYTSRSAAGSSQTNQTIAQAIAGATRVDARVRLTSAYSAQSSVRARLSAVTSEGPVPLPQVSSGPVAPGGTVTTPLNTAMLNTLRSSPGSLRIATGPGASNNSSDLAGFFGTDGNNNQRMRLQIDVWK